MPAHLVKDHLHAKNITNRQGFDGKAITDGPSHLLIKCRKHDPSRGSPAQSLSESNQLISFLPEELEAVG